MKKLFLFFVTILFSMNTVAFNSIKNLSDTLEIKSLNYNKNTPDSSIWINIDYPEIIGLKNSPVELKVNAFLENEFKESIEWYNEMQSDTALYEDMTYQMQYSFETGFQVEYNSEKFVSIILNHYEYTGGAHGNYFAVGYNIRMSDGKNLTLKNIIKPDSFDILADECEQAILEAYEAKSLLDAGLFENELAIEPDQDFYITPTALVIQFDPYEIGPYSMGEIIAEIPFEKIRDILIDNLSFAIN